MSFSDINNKSSSGGGRSGKGIDTSATHFGESLQQFQKNVLCLRDKISQLRRKATVNQTEKDDIDKCTQEVISTEKVLKNQLDAEMKQLDQHPRTTVAQKRIAIGKLQKDFERIKAALGPLLNESLSIRVTEVKPPLQSGHIQENGTTDSGVDNVKRVPMPRLIQTLQDHEIDQAIMEERERDLRKINQDLALVNEMFRDMADIVNKQGVMIDEIAVTTEQAHDRAKAGLEQVQKAATSQSSCILS